MISVGNHCLCLEGVCLPGGDTDQLHPGDSLFDSTAYGTPHVLPSMDRLAPLFWTLESRHDCFPLLQICQDPTRVSPHCKPSTSLFSRSTNNFSKSAKSTKLTFTLLPGKKRQSICGSLQKVHHAQTSKNTPLWYL